MGARCTCIDYCGYNQCLWTACWQICDVYLLISLTEKNFILGFGRKYSASRLCKWLRCEQLYQSVFQIPLFTACCRPARTSSSLQGRESWNGYQKQKRRVWILHMTLLALILGSPSNLYYYFFLSMLRFPGRFDCWGKTVLALLVWEFGSIWQLHLWVSTNIFSVESAVVVRLVALTRQYAWESSASCDRALGALQAGLVRLVTQGFCSFCLGCLSPNTLRPSPLVLPCSYFTSNCYRCGEKRKKK